MTRMLLAAALACAMSATAAPASAQLYAGYDNRQTFDLSARGSQASFDARVRLAARQYCGERMGRITLREYQAIRACKRDFIASARAAA